MPSSSTLIAGFLLVAVSAMVLVLWASQSDANEDGLMIAVFPPTANERTIMTAVVDAGGTYVRASLPETIIVAHSAEPGFAERLRAQGAWLTYGRSPFGEGLGGCLALATVPYQPATPRP